MRFSTSGFFHESVSPKPLSIPLGPFRKFAEIFAAQGAPPVSVTPVANGKKIFNYIKVTYRYIFAFKFTLRSQQPDIVPIICHRCHWANCRRYR
jgi:hypothetical protein